ncbi:UvrD-helicase domain-containing protein [Marinobacterium sp. MBR-109]|jgi:DNA helicase-2/ATP-dependent DNA helicase PcrA|uniref:UvrD-helicase domain-containing protein n=1 Tax=Marinobacterium sp. MBR-109 TaxID=3156462 RepID=UPI003398FDF7
MTQLNSAQQAAVDYNGDAVNLLVVAGAGCGKTRTIISRAARLVQQGVNPSSILLITFTNRAAQEIRQRIRQEVGELALELQISTFHGYCFSVMTRLPKSFEIKGRFKVIKKPDPSGETSAEKKGKAIDVELIP